MNKNETTTLSSLRIGDAFVFANRFKKTSDVWRVTARQDKAGRVAVNQVNPDTRQMVHKYDELKRASVRVVFLRHTVPVIGEECLLDDLVPGDRFKMPDDSVHTWILVRHGNQFSDVRRTDHVSCVKGGRAAKVIFVSH